MLLKKGGVYCVAALAVFMGASAAHGVPALQLYLEGATYDTDTETWVLVPPDSSGDYSFRLWAMGNVSGPGGHGPLDDVRLSAAYAASDLTPTIVLTPSTTGGYGGGYDPDAPTGTGTWIQTVTDGSLPVLGDGSSLPNHGIFGPGTYWQEFALGDFTGAEDASVADVIGTFPENPTDRGGQINVYDVSVSNAGGLTLHFDLYNTLIANNHAKFAPFSHDAEVVPIPGAALLAMTGLGLAGIVRRRFH